jgi:hypothetical protein
MYLTEEIKEKWAPVLEADGLPEITDAHIKGVTTRLLENQKLSLAEANVTGVGVDNWDPILISLVRRTMPQLMAYDVIGVQPMTGPTGLIFAMKTWYGHEQGQEVGAVEALSGKGGSAFAPDETHSGDMDTAVAETLGSAAHPAGLGATAGADYAEMSFSIEKTPVTAVSRALKAKYSTELAQDLKAIHGLDAETELANILSAEILNEINREIVVAINTQAKPGATAGAYDFTADSDGRWAAEKVKGMLLQINKEANTIGLQTGRGMGNWLIVSPNVASILDMTVGLDMPAGMGVGTGSINSDFTKGTFAGVLGGKYKVYVDQYAASDYITVGYKGSNAYDAGIFYCPYVPLQMMKSIGENDFQPRIGFKTRYAVQANPFALGGAGANPYFRTMTVANL